MPGSRFAFPLGLAALVSASCVSVPFGGDGGGTSGPPVSLLASAGRPSKAPGAIHVSEALLAAGEDSWLSPGPEPDVPDAPSGGGIAFRVAVGVGAPGGAEVGSAPGETFPTYKDVWTNSFALDVAAEFGGAGTTRPFARVSISKLYSKVWANPSDEYDCWQASETTLFAVSGGVKLGGGGDWKPYAKVGGGLVRWPGTSREDLLTGESVPMLAPKTGLALALGGGVEMSVTKLKGFVDLDYWIATGPEADPAANDVWDGFQSGGALGILTVTGGMKLAF